MKKLIIISFSLLCFISKTSQAQLTQQWLSTYNGPANNHDYAVAMATDNTGNVYVACTSNSGMISGNDFVVIKYNSAGVQQWASRYEGGYDERPVAMALDNTGHVYVTGKGFSPSTFDDYLTVKFNPNGDTAWVRVYNGPANNTDDASSIGVDNLGNVYVTGSSVGTGSGLDITTLKYNSSGTLMWTDRFNRSGADLGNDLALDAAGNIYVTGSSDSSNEHKDFVAIKLNPSGGRDWVGIYAGPNHSDDLANAIAVDNSGNAYVTGTSDLLMCTAKFSGSGNPAWVRTYTGPANSLNFSWDIIYDGTGNNLYVEGYSRESTNIYDYKTIKYSPTGTELWVQTYDANLEAYVFKNSLALDAAGNIYAAGPTGNAGLNSDYLILKYDPAGIQKWFKTFNAFGNADDRAVAVAVDNSNNDVIVTGSSLQAPSANYDVVTIKYSQILGINTISSSIPDKFSLFQNYPNPFNPSTLIKYELPSADFVSIKIYDETGSEVANPVNQRQSAGTYSVDWNASEFPSGIYFYSIKAGVYSETKKMILIK